MSITKKEHFIPRAAYLRRFSNTRDLDDHKNKLEAYSVNENRCYSTNVYDSAAINNLYEIDIIEQNSVEALFSNIEDNIGPFFDMLESLCSDPANKNCLVLRDHNERDNMKFFVVWQFFRTEKRKLQFQEDVGGTYAGKIAFLKRLVGKDEHGKPNLSNWKETLNHHYFVFEQNKTKIPFILPDDPVFAFHSEYDPPGTVNFRFPLTPWLQILLIDPNSSEHERMKVFRNRIEPVFDDSYVQKWNEKSIEEAYRTVYFTPGLGTVKDGHYIPANHLSNTIF